MKHLILLLFLISITSVLPNQMICTESCINDCNFKYEIDTEKADLCKTQDCLCDTFNMDLKHRSPIFLYLIDIILIISLVSLVASLAILFLTFQKESTYTAVSTELSYLDKDRVDTEYTFMETTSIDSVENNIRDF
jgi:hypothetical protein